MSMSNTQILVMDSIRRRRRKEKTMAVKADKITADILPREIWHDVLLRVDVKDLIRFRYVSKACNILVSDPCFRNMHFHQTKNNLKVKLMIHNGSDELYSLDYDEEFRHLVTTDDPLFIRNCERIWGSCNGLLCLESPSYDLYICNPSTRESKKLPQSPSPQPGFVVYGFGYNPDVNDYEVVGVDLYLFSYSYSLRKDSWRTIPNLPECTVENKPGQFVNGSLHWVVSRRSCNVLIAFAIGGDHFRELQLPEYKFTRHEDIYVEEYEGQLCTIHTAFYDDVHLWVMKDYGVKESWTKLFAISIAVNFPKLKPLCLTKNGFILFIEFGSRRLFIFNVKTKVGSYYLPFEGLKLGCEARSYVESIVGLVFNK